MSNFRNEVYFEQVKLLYKQSTMSLVWLMIINFILCFLIYPEVGFGVWGWYASLIAFSIARFYSGIIFTKQIIDESNVVFWKNLYKWGCLVVGLHWAAVILFFFPESFTFQNFIVFVIAGISAGATVVYAPVKNIYYWYLFPTIIPLLYRFFSYTDSMHISMGIMILMFGATMLITVKRVNAIIKESLLLAFEKEDLLEDLQIANEKIQHSNEMKSNFLANMSHEIRTPMNAVVGFTNLLNNSALSSQQKSYLDNIKVSSKNLLVIINDILDISKIEAGKLDLEIIAFELPRIAKNISATLTHRAQDKGLELNLEIGEKVPTIVFGDPTRLYQVLMNLTGNAIKFTESGKVTIKISTTKADHILFEVIDTGIGIPKNKLKSVFEKYTQAEGDTTRKFGGTGLGLSISQKLVEIFGGELKLSSTYGEGSNFYFELELTAGSIDDVEIEADMGKFNVDWLSEISILVVDDNEINRLLALETFKAWGTEIKIDTAEDGQVAVDKLKEKNYDVILMDMQMPVMSGLEATRFIRNNFSNPIKRDVKIIALTANALKSEENKCFEAGMNDYLAKPFEAADLLMKLAKVLDRTEELALIPVAPVLTRGSDTTQEVDKKQAADHMNYEFLINSFGDNNAVIKQVIVSIRKETPSQLRELATMIEHKNYADIYKTVHSLKNKMLYLNAEAFTKASETIERAAKNEKGVAAIKVNYDVLVSEWAAINEILALKLNEIEDTDT